MPVYRSRAALAFRVGATALVALVLAALLPGCGRRIEEEPGGVTTSSTATAVTPATTSPIVPSKPNATPNATHAESWNASQIDWQTYDAGLRLAKTQHKPVCLVFFTSWCPHCKNFSHVFDDPRVVAKARDFVMIHLDADAEEAVASKYTPDGSYIPRTFFLSPNGTIDDTIHAARPRSIYFYDERDPGPLLASMETAEKKLVN